MFRTLLLTLKKWMDLITSGIEKDKDRDTGKGREESGGPVAGYRNCSDD